VLGNPGHERAPDLNRHPRTQSIPVAERLSIAARAELEILAGRSPLSIETGAKAS
jgi:hypothetical protein